MEEAQFKVTLDARQADAALKKTRGEALTMAGSLEKLDRASMTSAKAVGALGGSMGALGSSSSNVLRGIGDVAGLLGSGSLLSVGLAVTTAAIVKGYEAWKDYKQILADTDDTLRSVAANLAALRRAEVAPHEGAAARFEKLAENYGKDEIQIAREEASATIDSLRERLAGVEERFRGGTDKTVIATLLESAKSLKAELKAAEDAYDRLVRADLILTGKKASSGVSVPGKAKDVFVSGEKVGGDEPWVRDFEKDELERQERANNAAVDLEDRRVEAARKANEKEIENHRRATEQMLTDKERYFDEVRALRDQQVAEDRQSVETAVGIGTAVASTYFNALAAGEENAAEKAVAVFLSSVGQQIVGLGTKAVVEGTLMNLALPGSGVALTAGGVAAIGIGVGMGAAAAQISASGSGPKAPQARTDEARSSGGVNRGRGSGGSRGTGGGQTVVNVTYSAAGPRPEDTGRAVADALDTHRRRTGEAR